MPNDREDAVALERLYDAHGPSCYRLASRMLSDESQACAVVRDVFLAVWSGEHVVDPSQGSVQAGLLSATHRRAVAALRRQRHLASGLVDSNTLGLQPKLGTVLRYVLELAYLGGYTESEIAALTGTTSSMAKTLTIEALRGMSAQPSTLVPRQVLSPR